jgi:hypothetical protein
MKKSSDTCESKKDNQNHFDASQWIEQTQLANQNFAKDNLALACQQYLETQNLAKKLFIHFKRYQPVPNALTPILVISYLNLADCRARQNRKKEQVKCLFEIYNFLKKILSESLVSEELSQQIYQGISKIHPDLCLCLKQLNNQEKLAHLEADFSTITIIYQAQTWAVH